MRTNHLKQLCIIFFFSFFIFNSSYSQTSKIVDFEAGGYVTTVISATPDSSVLYARTDVGGVYKKIGNGRWQFISKFATTPGGLQVQGIAVAPNNPNVVLIACGNGDAGDANKGIWKTTNGGTTWTKKLDINFNGNNFDMKTGGECIYFYKNNEVYAGGVGSGVYMSTNQGDNWTQIATYEDIGYNDVTSIAKTNLSLIIPTIEVVWIGTTSGLWKGTNDGGGWEGWSTEVISDNLVYRVVNTLFTETDYNLYVAYKVPDKDLENYGLKRIWGDRYNTYDDELADDFTDTYAETRGQIKSLFHYSSRDGNLLVSRTSEPARIFYELTDWSDFLAFYVDTPLPKHVLTTKTEIFEGRNFVNVDQSDTNIWHSSGGAGAYVSTNSGANWTYDVDGMNLPVVYDVEFDVLSNFPTIYFPLSDWSLARSIGGLTGNGEYEIYDYMRQATYEGDPLYDTYIPNVTRALISPYFYHLADPQGLDHIYFIGGSVYNNYTAMCKTDDATSLTPTYTQIGSAELELFTLNTNKCITDGLIDYEYANINEDYNSDHDKLIVFVGASTTQPVVGADEDGLGLFHSDNGGDDWNRVIAYDDAGLSLEQYTLSTVPSLFSSYKILSHDPRDKTRFFMYLESSDIGGYDGGGLFVSERDSAYPAVRRVKFVSKPVGTMSSYQSAGSICVDPIPNGSDIDIYVAIRNEGIKLTTNEGTNWSSLSGWTSADYIDVSDDIIVAFGKRSGDTYNKIYRSDDDGSNWTVLTDVITNYGSIPSVTSVIINPRNTDETWVATRGQGVFMFDLESSPRPVNLADKNKNLKSLTNYPNPFNPVTKIRYELAYPSKVKIEVFNILGQKVNQLFNDFQANGVHTVEFNASSFSSGVYFYRITTDFDMKTQRMLLIK